LDIAMGEILTSYSKIVRLQAENVEASRPIRASLDEKVHQVVTSLTTHEPKLQITRSVDDRGNSSIQASANGYDIAIATRSGQDSMFQEGKPRTFISYSLSAQGSLRSLDRAASFSRELRVILRGGGALLCAFLLFCGIDFLFRDSGPGLIHIPLGLVIVVVIAGGWLGERLGNLLGTKLEAGACARAERTGALPQLEFLWTDLERQFNMLLQPYDQV
jgi:hypothetical protein